MDGSANSGIFLARLPSGRVHAISEKNALGSWPSEPLKPKCPPAIVTVAYLPIFLESFF